MQILEPPQTESYSTEQGHFIKTFLISTKANEAGWKVSKCSIANAVKSFVGKPFVIIPDNLSSERQKGHIFANSRDELLEKYKAHTHGIIESVSEPFSYNDGTDDVFYTANIKLNDSKAASALLEHGTKTWIPFAVSPHIWHYDGPEDNITKWEGISLSLVPKGAYGEEAVVNKYCKGEAGACEKSLAAAFVKQELVPLTAPQLDDLHAAIRVNTEDIMESGLSHTFFLRPPSSDPIERLQVAETTGTFNYIKVSPKTTARAISSTTPEEAKQILSEQLADAQTGGMIHRDINDAGVETITRDPPLRDQYQAIVNKDLNDQYIAAGEKGDFELQTKIGGSMAFRENQTNAEYDSVIDEIQGDINTEKIDYDTDGQLISERFGWRSGSEAMAAGEYGQTNGGIRGITDSSVGGAGGECCIFNEFGGGGCGPCSGRAASIINNTVSSYVTKDIKLMHICRLIQLQKTRPM